MPYGKNDTIKNTNVNYSGRDFNDLKSLLMNYAKSYFPNTYRDFNETSPGMMLIELSAYVGDVLNFYVDQQYREMMLPLSEERKNILTLAKSQGYKVNPISPAYAEIEVKTTITADSNGKPNYSDANCCTVDKGMSIASSIDPSLVFETLEIVDFKASSSADIAPVVASVNDSTGIPTTYNLTRKVRAISGKTITDTFDIGQPKKFKKITLNETNVIEILSVKDSNGNVWYEVESLAQDKVPFIKHYSSDENRNTVYSNTNNSSVIKMPVPYSLEYIKTTKRFVTEIDEDYRTHLIFGNGILKNGNTFNASFLAIEQVGINLPGGEDNLEKEIDPLLGDAYGTLGEAPSNTTLTITYRIGGGVKSNINSDLLTNITGKTALSGNTTTLSVTNPHPSSGGTSGESVEEIRHRAMANIATQNRCVSKEDYEARSLNMPAKFGNIAKVYCARSGAIRTAQREKLANLVDNLKMIIDKNYEIFDPGISGEDKNNLLSDIRVLLDADKSGGLSSEDFEILYETLEMTYQNVTDDDRLYTVDLYLLSYDKNKNLTATPNIIKQNLKQYLNQYRLMTDQVSFYDGYVVNFGVIFDIVGQQYENKDEIKLRCIQAIKDYYSVDKMQFKQILYTNDIENLLMDVDGVRAVNYVTLTQNFDYNSTNGATEDPVFNPGLYTTVINSDGTTSTTSNSGYGYYFDFSKFYGNSAVAGKGIVLPAYEPAVFELKNPNTNIKGIVR
tara:strand:+ start:694 stop:2886 length:2193 start_codon:yes stop_codon:yes gene_type:complete